VRCRQLLCSIVPLALCLDCSEHGCTTDCTSRLPLGICVLATVWHTLVCPHADSIPAHMALQVLTVYS
jgi:hypothetical protein